MAEGLKTFEALFTEWTGPDCRIVSVEFETEDERDAWKIAEEIALLEGGELIYLSRC